MARILWIADAGRPTGFGTVTHAIGERLVEAWGHEIHVLAVGWEAEYPVPGPLKLYRAAGRNASSYLGYDRTAELVERVQPDVVVINEDIPMLWKRLLENRFDKDRILLKRQPVIAYVPIDGYNIPPSWKQLTELVKVVPYTRFAAEALGLPSEDVVPHGVDPIWRPIGSSERRDVRQRLGIPEDAFVIGRVDTNSGRKDWGSTWKVIQQAYELGLDEESTVSVFHTKLREPQSGVDLQALISRGRGKFMVTNEANWPIEELVRLVGVIDVFLTTTRGEGWGLNLAQSLACMVPVIATDCSSIPEVVGPGGVLVPGMARMTNPYGVDLVLADPTAMAQELVSLARNEERRGTLGAKGAAHVERFDWDVSAARFHQIIQGLLAQS